MALLTDLRQDFCAEVQRWQWVTQAAGKPVTQHGWAGSLLKDRSQPGAVLWKLVCKCQISCLEETSRWGEVRNTVPVLPSYSQEYFLQKWQATWQGAARLGDCETALALKRRSRTHSLTGHCSAERAKRHWQPVWGLFSEVGQLVANCAHINLNGQKSRSQEEKHPRRGRRKAPPALSDHSLLFFLLWPQLSIPMMHILHLQRLTGIRT